MLTGIQNGQIAKLSFVLQRRKNTCETLLKILWKEGYILGYQVLGNNPNYFKIFLKYKNDKSVVNCIKKLSNPNSRLFYCVNDL
jgi:ribosomal protein S8